MLGDFVMDGTDWMIPNPLLDGTGSVFFRCSSPQRDPPLHKLHDSPAVRSFFRDGSEITPGIRARLIGIQNVQNIF